MTLLREIAHNAASEDVDLPSLLRKCKILAARLGSPEFSQWVDCELNGYLDAHPTPEYRRLQAGFYARFMNIAWRVDKTPVPKNVVPEEHWDSLYTVEFRGGIAQIAALAPKGATIQRPELTGALEGEIYAGLNCLGAWQEVPASEFAQLMSAVRNRILDFALQIENENPDAGEAPPHSQPIPTDRLQPLINNYFGPTNIAQNSHHFSQTAKAGLQPRDLDSLKSYLISSGVPRGEIAELEKAIVADNGPASSNGEIGPRVKEWIGKAATGTWEIAKGTSIQLIVAAIKHYYGLGA